MKRVLIATALVSLFIAAAAPAFAQTATPQQPGAEQMMERGHHGIGRHGHGPGGPRGLIDMNFDNVIGEDEAASLADRDFQRMDSDRNGALSEAEFSTLRGKGRWWNWAATQDQAVTDGFKAKFAALDQDKNASVSKAEFLADAKTRYAASDADKDGKITPWEFRAAN
jgi:EF hand